MDSESLTQTDFAIDLRDFRPRGFWPTLRHTTFRSLRHRNYRLYFYGQLVSFIGSWMQSAALMWLVFEKTDDALWPPLLLVATVAPTLFLGPIGGLLADRFPKKSVIFAAQCAFLLTSLILVGLLAADRATPGAMLAVAFANGIVQAIDLPARLAFVRNLVPKSDLINAVSLNSLLFNSARAIGPALAGLTFLIAAWWPAQRPVYDGAMACFVVNSLSFVAVLAALWAITVRRKAGVKARSGRLFEGLHYLRARPTLAALLLLTGLLSFFGWPALTLFPAYTRQVLGHSEKEYSILVSALGFGALVGALVTATFGTVALRGALLTVGAMLSMLGIAGLSLADTIVPAAVGAAALGGGLIVFLSTAQSALQLSVDDARRGRVMALWAMTLSASAPAGHLLAGTAARVYPLPDVLMVMAAGSGVTALLVAALARWGMAIRP